MQIERAALNLVQFTAFISGGAKNPALRLSYLKISPFGRDGTRVTDLITGECPLAQEGFVIYKSNRVFP